MIEIKLQDQPSRWSCGATSLAMLFGIPVQSVFAELGHDGSEIIDPSLPEPECRRGFHIQEFYDFALMRSHTFGCIETNPMITNICPLPMYEGRLERYMFGRPGLVIGEVSLGKDHMVAWSGLDAFDPTPTATRRIMNLVQLQEHMSIEVFLPLYGIKS